MIVIWKCDIVIVEIVIKEDDVPRDEQCFVKWEGADIKQWFTRADISNEQEMITVAKSIEPIRYCLYPGAIYMTITLCTLKMELQ